MLADVPIDSLGSYNPFFEDAVQNDPAEASGLDSSRSANDQPRKPLILGGRSREHDAQPGHNFTGAQILSRGPGQSKVFTIT